jgi:hypothetical protein
MKKPPRTIRQIIDGAGGAAAVANTVTNAGDLKLTADAVYKWQHNGIPDRYWATIIRLADSSADEIFAANEAARAEKAA